MKNNTIFPKSSCSICDKQKINKENKQKRDNKINNEKTEIKKDTLEKFITQNFRTSCDI